jgi:hypothetical protein
MYLDCICPAKAFTATATAAISGLPHPPRQPFIYTTGTIYTFRITIPMSDLMQQPIEGVIMYLDCMCPAKAFAAPPPSTGQPHPPHGPVMYATGTIYTLIITIPMSDLMKWPLKGMIMY